MKLPGAEYAVVELAKLRDYSLNLLHERGCHKAHVFQAALGLTVAHAEWLRAQLLQMASSGEAYEIEPSVFGRRFVLDYRLEHDGKAALVRTAWIIEHGTSFPRLTSCYVI